MSNEASPDVAGAVYVHPHEQADGTMVEYRADNRDAAIKLCPKLGELATEAPDQLDAILKLSALGNELLADRPKPEQPKPETPTKPALEEPAVETVKPEAPAAELRELPAIVSPDLITFQQAEQSVRQDLLNEAETIDEDEIVVSEPSVLAATKPARIIVTRQLEKPKPAEHSSPKAPEAYVPLLPAKLPIRREPLIAVNLPEDRAPETTFQATETEVPSPVVLPSAEAITPYPDTETDAIIVEPERTLVIPDQIYGQEISLAETSNAEPVEMNFTEIPADKTSSETEIDTPEEAPALDPETIDTYDRLVQLLTMPEVPADEMDNTADAEAEVPADFEAFIASLPENEEPVPLEVIREQGDAQPLEETLAQIAEYLAVNLEEAEQDEIIQIIQEIKEVLPACYVTDAAGETSLQITPELTDKLLVLMRNIGYEHPAEALVAFIETYDLAFLLQALEYLCQLNDETNRQEFLFFSSAVADTADDGLRPRLGRALIALAAVK